MRTGYYISGIGHLALIIWILFGGLFLRAHDAPMPAVSEVSVISSEEFAVLTAASNTPPVPEAVEPSDTPVPDANPGQGPAAATPPDTPPEPEPVPKPEPAPEVKPEPRPQPAQPPEPPAPDPGSADAPRIPNAPPKPEPAPRVADPAPQPAPDATVAPEVTPEVAPSPEPAEVVKPETPPAAPEAAAPEIVTEAERPTHAPTTSMRPKARPAQRPVEVAAAEPPPDAKPDPKPATPDPKPPKPDAKPPRVSGVDAALAEANAGDNGAGGPADVKPAAPSGPPLTGGEKDGFAIAVKRCWVIDPGSEAARITVDIAFSMNPDGTVISNSLKMVRASDGSDAAVKTAYETGRRAILRCGAKGYDLPAEKYGQWQNVEISFNPDKMRMK